MAEGGKLTEEDCAVDSLETMKIDNNQEKAVISHPTPTTIDTIVLEILDIIIEKSCVLFIQRKNRALASEKEVLKLLASVSHCWFRRITKRKFKNAVWSYLSSADRLNMENQKDRLEELIESEFGLLGKLLKCGALTRVKMAKVKSGATIFEKNEFLLNYIFSGNKHQDLMKALTDCGQHHVVNWVRGNGEYREEYGDDWPLKETEVRTLDNNHEALVDCLRASEILPILFANQEINDRQRESIDSERTEYQKNEALLETVRRFNLKSYSVFIQCVRLSGQPHVADILQHGGSIVPVHARLECRYLDVVETQIVNKMENVLMGNVSVEQADRLVAALQLRVIAMRRGRSIVVYISFNKEEEFIHLCDIITNLEMRNILEQLFNLLVPNVEIKVLLATILSRDIEKAKKILKEIKRESMNTKDNAKLSEHQDKDSEEKRWKMTFDRHHDFIIDRMSPDFGLIDKLYSNFAITEDEKYKIKAEKDVQKRNEILIKCIGRKLELGKLIQVLRESDQKHLVKYLENDGNYNIQDSEEERWKATFDRHHDFIVDRMSPDFGLIDKLYSNSTITSEEREEIEAKKDIQKRNRNLIKCLERKLKLRILIEVLHESDQKHLVNYLESDGEYKDVFDGEWPLTEKEISAIKSNYEALIDLADMVDILNPLFAMRAINRRQREFISSKFTFYEKNKALLEIVRRGSLRFYWQTIRCLHQTKQSHIAEILETGGVIVPVHATLESENLDDVEAKIVKEMAQQADDLMPDASAEQRRRLIEALHLRLNAMRRGK